MGPWIKVRGLKAHETAVEAVVMALGTPLPPHPLPPRGVSPHSADATVKITTEVRNTRRRPNWLDSQPVSGMVMAAETIRRGLSGRVTASHTTAMHSYNNAYAYRLISNIARAGLHMVTNPLDNAVLQGRFDTGPLRRGHTRVKQLLAAGVNVCVGHDSVMDPWYPLGYGDPLQAAFVLVHLGQMSGDGELRQLIEMITTIMQTKPISSARAERPAYGSTRSATNPDPRISTSPRPGSGPRRRRPSA